MKVIDFKEMHGENLKLQKHKFGNRYSSFTDV